MKKYEYWVVRREIITSDETLNDFGMEGWELVGVLQVSLGDCLYYFKRPLEN